MSTVADDIWGVKVDDSEGGSYERPSPGMYPAALIGLIDLGTHSREVQDQKTGAPKTIEQRKLYLVWELTNEFDSEGKPFVMAKDFTWSMHKQSKLRPLVESWLGKSAPVNEEFNIISLLGKVCFLTVTERRGKNEKSYAEFGGVGPVPKGMVVPPPMNEPFAFNTRLLGSAKDELAIPEWVPKLFGRSISDEIRASKEFKALPPF